MNVTFGRRASAALRTIVLAVSAALVASLFTPVGAISPAAAANRSDFNPGLIVSDMNFFDARMSEAEIQSFLVNRVGRCTNSNCLANYVTTTPTRTWSWGTCSTYVGAANESAARIIFKVQNACGISAQAILVTLQKEQGLLTNSAPTEGEMRAAMGFACPDTGACDSTYYGFFNQVFAAARQFTWYSNPAGSFTSIVIGGVNSIRFNPNPACGSSNVLIQNRATAALYYYTPYQPNDAALANLYGIGDGCSAYGNRNFWRLWSDWFGDPATDHRVIMSDAATRFAASLGAATTDYLRFSANGGGWVRGYQNGAVTLAQGASTASVLLSGPIRTYYNERGGVGGSMGWPVTNPNAIAASGGGTVQGFQNAAIASSSAGTFALAGVIRAALNAAGGIGGAPGWPTSDAVCSGNDCVQRFASGAIYAGGSSAWFVPAALDAIYQAAGGPAGSLGAPTGPTVPLTANGGGTVQAFVNGAIASTAAGGTRVLSGAIRTAFNARGGISTLGWPTSDPACDGSICRQVFQFGTLFAGTGVDYLVDNRIAPTYIAAGGPGGSLGVPTSGLLTLSVRGGGVAQYFANGVLVSSAAGGARALTGTLRNAFNARGGISALGWPTGDPTCAGASCVQAFQAGTLYAVSGASYLIDSRMSSAYAAAGGPTGALGAPVGGLVTLTARGGGAVQPFANGAIA
ncbi:MAG TPA: hypothetical protein VK139_08040, partial [Microbacteriaceae bacterium]|nr:hypothetical protein [Microbacteriaceae bacterium]